MVLATGIVILILLVGRLFLVDNYQIRSCSMEPVLLRGDRVLVNTICYGLSLNWPVRISRTLLRFRGPEPGDVVAFFDPVEPSVLLVKRCLAIAGQRVILRNDDLIVVPDTVTGGLTVPPGYFCAVGDHPEHSVDSRHRGFFPTRGVIGRLSIVYFSRERREGSCGTTYSATGWIVLRWFRSIRWKRIARLVR
jgi:signal peptidase I